MELQPFETKIQLCREPELGKKVSFAVDSAISQSKDSPGDEIFNLCEMIISPIQYKEWLGYVANTHGRKHRIRALHHQSYINNERPVLLEDVLDDTAFKPKDRRRLAVQLASSIIQLHTCNNTEQWLTDQWSRKDIFFARSSDGSIDFRHPLIRRGFGQDYDRSESCISSHSQNSFGPLPCLFSLGILLLELVHRKRFEDMRLSDETIMPQPSSDSATATRLTDLLECSPHYHKVVKRCIGGLDAAFDSLNEDEFRNEVDEKILYPLEEDLKYYFQKESVEECI